MKKILTILFVLLMGISFAQDGGLMQRGEKNENAEETSGLFNRSEKNKTENNTPIGSGVLLLTAFSAAYAIGKKRLAEK